MILRAPATVRATYAQLPGNECVFSLAFASQPQAISWHKKNKTGRITLSTIQILICMQFRGGQIDLIHRSVGIIQM